MFKNPYKTTLTFSEKQGEQIKSIAAEQHITPYALLKSIVMTELKLKEEKTK